MVFWWEAKMPRGLLNSGASGRYSAGCVTNDGDKRVAARLSSRKPINNHDIIQCEDSSNITGSCSWASIQSNDVVVQARCPTAQPNRVSPEHQMWLDDNLTPSSSSPCSRGELTESRVSRR